MDNELMARFEKQLEGNTLAMSALAEILMKMDEKQEEEDKAEMEKMQKAVEMQKQEALVKAIAEQVYSMVKADQGMDVDGTKVRAAADAGRPAADAEVAANPTTKSVDQQAAIQAAEMEDDEDEEEDGKGMEKAGSAEYPKTEDDGEDDGEEMEKGYMNAMRKELDALRKQVAAYEANMEKAVQTEAETRLRKMGFREERGLVSPRATGEASALGVDGSTPLVKSEDAGDVVETLSNLDWKTLRTWQAQIQLGNTEGVPAELLK